MPRTGTSERKVSNPLGLAVMALLFERPMHPYEMAATLRERAKEESIKLRYGSLYTVIAALEREGLIEEGERGRQGARPERTTYLLTPKGEVELRCWMRELLSTPVKEYAQFEAALSLMPVLPPKEVVELLQRRLELLENEVEKSQAGMASAEKQGVERLFLIESEYRMAMREAERAWVKKLRDLLRTSSTFTRTWKQLHAKRRAENGARPSEQRRKRGHKDV